MHEYCDSERIEAFFNTVHRSCQKPGPLTQKDFAKRNSCKKFTLTGEGYTPATGGKRLPAEEGIQEKRKINNKQE